MKGVTTLPFGIVVNCQDTPKKITANQDTDFLLDKPSNQVSCVLFFTVKIMNLTPFHKNPSKSGGVFHADL